MGEDIEVEVEEVPEEEFEVEEPKVTEVDTKAVLQKELEAMSTAIDIFSAQKKTDMVKKLKAEKSTLELALSLMK